MIYTVFHEMTENEVSLFFSATTSNPKLPKINPQLNYFHGGFPMQHGLKSDFTTPLLIELFDKGQIKELSTVLADANLTIKERGHKRRFDLVSTK